MESFYQSLIESAFENAERNESKITEEIIGIEGMSGTKTRHFYNNLLNTGDARYLEIGTWKGSSVCSAMYGNKAKVVCIDNWSEFGGPKDEFLVHFEKFKGKNDATFIESDCFKVNVSQLSKFNIYMFDGNHSEDSHYKALVHYYSCLDDIFIFLVDDWNWEAVRNGTRKSIQDLNLTVLYEKEIRLTWDNSHTLQPEAKDTWWNGIYVAILQKRSPVYSRTWFHPKNFQVLEQFQEKENINFLEIGSFEGMSTNYFIQHYLTGKNSFITCIDPWIKYSESTITKMAEWDDVINENTFDIFTKNTRQHQHQIIVKRGLSLDVLPTLEKIYHFIYIDGDHSEKAVWVDAEYSFKILCLDGIMIFDDYDWNQGDKNPKKAIDRFISVYKDCIQVIDINHQAIIRKVKELE
jgi:predicted O-methyltransferase YrrM